VVSRRDQGLVAEAGGRARGDAVIQEEDRAISDLPSIQEVRLGLGKAGVPAMAPLVCFLGKGRGKRDPGPSGNGPGEIIGAIANRRPAGRWRRCRDTVVVVPDEGEEVRGHLLGNRRVPVGLPPLEELPVDVLPEA